MDGTEYCFHNINLHSRQPRIWSFHSDSGYLRLRYISIDCIAAISIHHICGYNRETISSARRSYQQSRFEILDRMAKLDGLGNVISFVNGVDRSDEILENVQSISKLLLLRRSIDVSQLLYDASQTLYGISSISLAACCFNSFAINVFNTYFSSEFVFLSPSAWDTFVLVVCLIRFLNEMRILSDACEIANQKVWSTPILNIFNFSWIKKKIFLSMKYWHVDRHWDWKVVCIN